MEKTTFIIDDISIDLYLDPLVWAPTSFAKNMAPHLTKSIQKGNAVLELGLGSGVLAILAAKLGATRVVALDINQQAIPLATQNWQLNHLSKDSMDFRHSDLWSALNDTDQQAFDVIWSNPPVLPVIKEINQVSNTRDDFEVAGDDGRKVLDAVLSQAGAYLKPQGQLLTIATSLQGWQQTESLLNQHWQHWEIIQSLSMELTEECTEEYIAWWQKRDQQDGQKRIYKQHNDENTWWHDVWYLKAWEPRF